MAESAALRYFEGSKPIKNAAFFIIKKTPNPKMILGKGHYWDWFFFQADILNAASKIKVLKHAGMFSFELTPNFLEYSC